MRRAWILAGCGACTLGFAALVACGGGAPVPVTAKVAEAPGGSHDPSKWPADDHSLCEGFLHWKNNPAFDADEMVGADSIKPNIRRIYKTVGERDSRRTVLLCREADTNLDGLKDVVRTFNEKGEPLHEEADTNFDGKIDDWLNFTGGRISEEDVDTTYTKGRPNVWKFFVDGQLSRIRRNSHCAGGNPDTWEIYFNNRLERVGVDNTCDGHVDRWDRDAQLMASEESAQQAAPDGGAASGGDSGPPECDPSAGPCVADGGASSGRAAKKAK
jgi:hypothetical protein